jgi:hypothetical protein
MKHLLLFAALISFACCNSLLAQAPPTLQQPFAILTRTYPHVEAKRFVRAPADSAWQFRADSSSVGSVEIGFQGDQVVYMVFRRGVGGVSWKREEINALHDLYWKDLLHEKYCGERYVSALAPPINAATITRKDFDAKSLMSGL